MLAERLKLEGSLDTLDAELRNVDSAHTALRKTASGLRERRAATSLAMETAESWVAPLAENLAMAIERSVGAHQIEIERQFRAMIPSPHRFDGITVRNNKDRLELGIEYRGQHEEAGEPRMFLSSAQLNVLALSIFLSFSASQDWSRLNCILLDDPVQHLGNATAQRRAGRLCFVHPQTHRK